MNSFKLISSSSFSHSFRIVHFLLLCIFLRVIFLLLVLIIIELVKNSSHILTFEDISGRAKKNDLNWKIYKKRKVIFQYFNERSHIHVPPEICLLGEFFPLLTYLSVQCILFTAGKLTSELLWWVTGETVEWKWGGRSINREVSLKSPRW